MTSLEFLPEIILYIIPGYVLYSAYRFAALRINVSSWNDIVLKSIAISFILNSIAEVLHIDISSTIYQIFVIVVSVILGIIGGKIASIEKIKVIINEWLKINRGLDDNIFSIVIDNNLTWWRVKFDGEDSYYIGQVEYIDQKRNLATLVYYQKVSSKGQVLENYEEEESIFHRIIINYEKAKSIEIIKDVNTVDNTD